MSKLDDKTIQSISKISEEIINIPVEMDMKIKDLLNSFYDIMRKYGITHAQAIYDENGNYKGCRESNFEWTLFFNLFLNRIKDKIDFMLLLGEVPEDMIKY